MRLADAEGVPDVGELSATAAKEGVPPLLLSPSEYGIGLGGDCVSIHGPRAVRGAGRNVFGV